MISESIFHIKTVYIFWHCALMNPLFVLLILYFGAGCNCFLYIPLVIRSDTVAKRLYSRNKTQGQDEQTDDFFVTNTITTSTILNIESRAENLVEKTAESLVENSEQFKSIMKKCELLAEEKVNRHFFTSDKVYTNDEPRVLLDVEELDIDNLRKWKIKKNDSSSKKNSSSETNQQTESTLEAKNSSMGKTNQKDEEDVISCIKSIIDGIARFLGSLLSTEPKKQVKYAQEEVVTLEGVEDWLGYIDAEFSKVKSDANNDTKESQMQLKESSLSGIIPIDRQTTEHETVSLNNALGYMRNALERLGIQQDKLKQ